MEQGLQKGSARKLAEALFGEDYVSCSVKFCDVPATEGEEIDEALCMDHASELEAVGLLYAEEN
jgi:hypothetical protein